MTRKRPKVLQKRDIIRRGWMSVLKGRPTDEQVHDIGDQNPQNDFVMTCDHHYRRVVTSNLRREIQEYMKTDTNAFATGKDLYICLKST